MNSRTYRVNAPLIATEKLDDEVMIVNLDKGNYYSLTGTGAFVWDLIVAGHTETSVVAEITARYVGDSAVMRQSTERFVSDLRDEQLIVERDNARTNGNALTNGAAAPVHAATDERPDFAAPQLEKYTDMQELLLIDPIHEVNDDHGWPKMKS